jgi:rhamnogalacturonyl hydrolase YesR
VCIPQKADNGTLFNYIDSAPTSFPDSSGTALIAASTFRLATLTGDLTHIPAAEKAFNLIKENISEDGWLMDVVDPLAFDKPGTRSPEGQSFVLLLYSARRDFIATHKMI